MECITSGANPPGHFPWPSSLGGVPLLCSLLMSYPYTVLWLVPSLGISPEQAPCVFLVFGSTKPGTWATLNKGLKNCTDVLIAPNQSQPQPHPPCPVTFLYWVVSTSCHWGILWLFTCFASCCLDHLFPSLIVLSVTFLENAVLFFVCFCFFFLIGIGDLLDLLIFCLPRKPW